MTTPDEPNKTRTIPLHIADQAVAACEKEIARLKAENQDLENKLERLEEVDKTADRLYDEVMFGIDMMKSKDAEIARLKAEVERLRKAGGCDEQHSNRQDYVSRSRASD